MTTSGSVSASAISSEGDRTVSVRRATLQDVEMLSQIKSNAWGGADTVSWTRRWTWQFNAHPGQEGNEPSFLVAEMGGVTLGGIGWLPAVLDASGTLHRAGFACDIFVDRSAQRTGAGGALVQRLIQECPLTIWMSASNAMVRFLVKGGFLRVHPVRYMILPLVPGEILRPRLPGWLAPAGAFIGFPLTLAHRALRGGRRAPAGIRIETDVTFDPAWDEFVERLGRPGLVSPRRDAAYMRWRFQQCPFGPYEMRIAKAGREIVGLSVFRFRRTEEMTLGVLAGFHVDPERPDVARFLLAESVRAMEAGGAHAIKSLVTTRRERRTFLREGFLPTLSTPHVFLTPEPARQAGLPLHGRHWDLTLGDVDMDFS